MPSLLFLIKICSHKLKIGLYSLCLLLATCTPQEPIKVKQSSKKYQTIQVQKRTLVFPVKASGVLALEQEISLAFKLGGTIERIYVDEGQNVQAGQTLALLSSQEVEERYQQAQNNYLRLKSELERSENLFEKEVINLQQIEQIRTAYKIASSDLKIAETSRGYTKLKAPSTGIVLKKYQEEGEVTGVGRPVLRISGQADHYVFKAGLADAQVVKVHLNDQAKIKFSAYPQEEIEGEVTNIATSPNPMTGLYEVEILFKKNELQLKPGFLGDVALFAPQEKKYSFIPAEALIEAKQRQGIVYIKNKNNQIVPQKVTIAHILNEEIAISKGLENIQQVFIP